MVDWLYDELVLVADAVRASGRGAIPANSPEAHTLSALLRRGQLHPGVFLPDDFRSPASIQRKSYDLVTSLPDYSGVPTRGGKLTAQVSAELAADADAIRARAQVIRELLLAGAAMLHLSADDDVADEMSPVREGGLVEIVATRRERDPGIRAKKIAAVKRSGGLPTCEACGFDFGKVYGERGSGYIEVHHVNPLHVTGPTETSLDDLALVCANCHRMCHRGPWITPAEVAMLIGKEQR
jgi:5-methylcytosine-specific restriction protein A